MRTHTVDFSTTLSGSGVRVGIIAARFNPEFSDVLLQEALALCGEVGVRAEDIQTVRVPGVYELALPLLRLAEGGRVDGLIALGTVIEGATPHFDKLCSDVTDKVSHIMMKTGVPIGFGVVMARTQAQATERASRGSGNKGREAAAAMLEMVHVLRELT